jgi:hypothetical protein
MQCPKCELPYEGEVHVPRILINCGHTTCEECIKQLLGSENSLSCPECNSINKAESVNSFPKNFALLNMRIDTQPTTSTPQTSVPTTPVKPKEDIIETMCSTHQKKIEAYCMQDKIILCIDCILSEGHKTHEINSINNAANSEKALLLDLHKRS